MNDILCYSETGDSMRISSILNNDNIVVLYGGSNYCNSCIDYHIQTINSMIHFIGERKILILFKNVTKRELAIIKSSNKLKVALYATKDDLSLPLDDDQPVFFILNSNLLVSNTFYPIKEKADYNSIFYNFLKQRE